MSKLIKCPGCDLELPKEDFFAQREHIDAKHPQIVKERLIAAGLWDDVNNRPVYSRPNDALFRIGEALN